MQDIEDLVKTAKIIKGCPYYASRKAAEGAEVVLIPYNTILHKPTREANGNFTFITNIMFFFLYHKVKILFSLYTDSRY